MFMIEFDEVGDAIINMVQSINKLIDAGSGSRHKY